MFRRIKICLRKMWCWDTNQQLTKDEFGHIICKQWIYITYSENVFVSCTLICTCLRHLIHLRQIICPWYNFKHWVYKEISLKLTTPVHDFLDMSCMANKQQLSEFGSWSHLQPLHCPVFVGERRKNKLKLNSKLYIGILNVFHI